MTQDNTGISLESAFSHVLRLYEEKENVPEDRRLGVLLNGKMPFEWPKILATGLKFNEPIVAVTHPNQGPPPPRRHGETPRAITFGPPVSYVPEVPSNFQLDRLLHDELHAPMTQSNWEKRICRTHRWLLAALTDELAPIDSWGWCMARFPGDKYNFLGERRNGPDDAYAVDYTGYIDRDFWQHGSISYKASRVLGGDLDWCIPIDNALYEGRLNVEDIRLDREQFLDRVGSTPTGEVGLPEAAPSKEVVTLCGQPIHGLMTWSIERRGQRIDLHTDPDAGLERGLRALVVLIQNPGKRVSNFLIEGLERRDSHGRQTDPAKNKEADDLAKEIAPLSQELLLGRKSVDELHERLKESMIKLCLTPKEIKDTTKYFAWAMLSRGDFVEKGNLIGKHARRNSQNVIPQIKKALDLIEEKAGLVWAALDDSARQAHKLIENFIQRDVYSYKYDLSLAAYDWKARASFGAESAVESHQADERADG